MSSQASGSGVGSQFKHPVASNVHRNTTVNPVVEDLKKALGRKNGKIRRLQRQKHGERKDAAKQRTNFQREIAKLQSENQILQSQGQEKDLSIKNLRQELSKDKRELLIYKVHVIKLNNENSKLNGLLDNLQTLIHQSYNIPHEERDIKPRLNVETEEGEIAEMGDIADTEKQLLCQVFILPPVTNNPSSDEGPCGAFNPSNSWISEFLKHPASGSEFEPESECYKVFIRLYREPNPRVQQLPEIKLGQPLELTLNIPSLSTVLGQLTKVQLLIHAWEMDVIENEILKFFFSFCDRVTHFSIGQSQNQNPREWQTQMERSEIFYVMSDLFPNLEYFAITDQNTVSWNGIWEHENVTWDPLPLSSLKMVKLLGNVGEQMSEEFLRKLMWMTPNLEEIHGVPPRYIKHIACLELELDALSFLHDGEGGDFYHGIKTFFQMLQVHQKKLTKLRIIPVQLNATVISYPTLKKLKTIQFQLSTNFNNSLPSNTNESPRAFFPSYLKLDKTFPNLENVEIFYGDGGETISQHGASSLQNFEIFYGEGGENIIQHGASSSPSLPLVVLQPSQTFPPSVKSVKLQTSNFISTEFLTHLFPLPPFRENIKEITLNSTPLILRSILPTAFSLWSKMEVLTLELQMNNNDQIVSLDRAFTGRSKGMYHEGIKDLCDTTPVYEMRDLKLLQIIICNGQVDIASVPILSECGIAFQWMNKCRFVIKFSDDCTPEFINKILPTLESIGPFVVIEDSK